MKKLFSIVIPVYKNELNLPVTIPYILERIPTLFPDYRVELILVNDGSPDGSWEIMKKYQSEYPETIRIAQLVHNFGQVSATSCGIRLAKGNAVGVISADLQDPFELFPDMLAKLEQGYDLVCGVREGRMEKGINVLFSKVTHRLIKRFIDNQYPAGGFDFYVMNRAAATRFLQVQERNGSMQLSLLWASGSVIFIPYIRQEREIGASGWTFSKKIKYFIDIFASSYLPIRTISVVGIISALAAFIATIYVFITSLRPERVVPGWASIVLLIMFFSGLILASLGVIGEYIWRIYDQVRGRPQYFVREYCDNIQEGHESNVN